MADTPVQYPEHEKMSEITSLSEPLGGFLEWLSDSGYQIMRFREDRNGYGHWETPDIRGINGWLAAYFDIDLVKIDTEKSDMLRRMRETQNR